MARAQVDLRFEFDGLSCHKLQIEAARECGDVDVHFHQGEMIADAGVRANPERKCRQSGCGRRKLA